MLAISAPVQPRIHSKLAPTKGMRDRTLWLDCAHQSGGGAGLVHGVAHPQVSYKYSSISHLREFNARAPWASCWVGRCR